MTTQNQQASEDRRARNILSPGRTNDAYILTKDGAYPQYARRLDQQASPLKYAKQYGAAGGSGSQQNARKYTGPSISRIMYRADETGQRHDTNNPFGNNLLSPLKKVVPRKYLVDSDRANSLGNSNKRMRSTYDAVAAEERAIGFISPPNRKRELLDRETLPVIGLGARLSRTPPPLSTEYDDPQESPLPPTPERHDASPDAIKRGLEVIYSSGRPKQSTSIEPNMSPHQSPTLRKPRPHISAENTDIYYPVATASVKDKLRKTLLEHRDTLQREIKLLESELTVENRKSSISRSLKSAISSPEKVSALIVQCLDINDERVSQEAVTNKNLKDLQPGSHETQQVEMRHNLEGHRGFCYLNFANCNAQFVRHKSRSRYERTIQGFSHESLLQFRVLLDVFSGAKPVVHQVIVECSDWARGELGQALLKFSSERNINLVLYTLSSYAEMATNRAETWAILEERFSDLVFKGTTRGKPVSRMAPDVVSKGKSKFHRRLLVKNLSRKTVTFRGLNVMVDSFACVECEISLTWNIIINASGESQSSIFACFKLLSSAPDAYGAQFSRQVSDLFKILVAEYGVAQGASKLIESLFMKGKA